MFVGTFEHSLDDKGRLVLPSVFRGRLSDGAFLTPYESCLALWPEEEFRAFVDHEPEISTRLLARMDELLGPEADD